MMKTKLPAVRVMLNIWGNYNCYTGRVIESKYASEFDAMIWLAGKIKAGNPIAPTSEFTAVHAADYAKYV